MTRTHLPARRNAKIHLVPRHFDRAAHRWRDRRQGEGDLRQDRTCLSHKLPAGIDQARVKGNQVVEHDQIGAPARRNGAAIAQAEPLGSIQGPQAQRLNRIDPESDRLPHHEVDAALVEQVRSDPVVGAEADAAAVRRRDQRQQGTQIVRVGSFPDQDVETTGQLFCSLRDRRAFMLAADARGGVGVEAVAGQPWGMAIAGAPHKGGEFLQDGAIALNDARIVHHFGQPIDGAVGQQSGQTRRHPGARRWFPYGWQAHRMAP